MIGVLFMYVYQDIPPEKQTVFSSVPKAPAYKAAGCLPNRDQHKHIICPLFSCDTCGLGNFVFQFASAYGIALHLNMTLVITVPDRFITLFQITDKKNINLKKNRKMCDKMKLVEEKHGCCSYDKQFRDLEPSQDYKIGHYLHSWKYFRGYEAEVRKQLVFRRSIQNTVKTVISRALLKYGLIRSETTIVGIHIRRGDMTLAVKRKRGYNVASKRYIEQAISLFSKKINNTLLFLIASNDLVWTKTNIIMNPKLQRYDFELLQNNTPEIDFAILSSCDHVITSVGTFGWWTGWLSGGMVTYFKWPARPGTFVGSQYNQNFTDFFYSHWIGIG